MNHHYKIWTFMLEFYICSIIPFHSKDFQLLWTSYIGLHRLRTTNAFPLSINLSLVKYWRQKIIILDAETSNLPTRKFQPVNAYMYGTRNNFKKRYSAAFQLWNLFLVHIFYTCKLVKCHHAAFIMVCTVCLGKNKDLRAKNIISSSRRKRKVPVTADIAPFK